MGLTCGGLWVRMCKKGGEGRGATMLCFAREDRFLIREEVHLMWKLCIEK